MLILTTRNGTFYYGGGGMVRASYSDLFILGFVSSSYDDGGVGGVGRLVNSLSVWSNYHINKPT